jgi:hypothetical protein
MGGGKEEDEGIARPYHGGDTTLTLRARRLDATMFLVVEA